MSAQRAAEAIAGAVEHCREDLVTPSALPLPRFKVSFPGSTTRLSIAGLLK